VGGAIRLYIHSHYFFQRRTYFVLHAHERLFRFQNAFNQKKNNNNNNTHRAAATEDCSGSGSAADPYKYIWYIYVKRYRRFFFLLLLVSISLMAIYVYNRWKHRRVSGTRAKIIKREKNIHFICTRDADEAQRRVIHYIYFIYFV